MINKNILKTPEGTRDFLFEECAVRREVENKLSALYKNRGYSEIVTPVLEFYNLFEGEITDESMFKFSDSKNRLLALRSDLTLPAVRIAATRLKDSPMPLRLFYNQNIYRTSDDKSTEIAQSGIELLGADGIAADVEIITTAVDVLNECGGEFRFELGDVGFFKALINDVPLKDSEKETVRMLIESKNFALLGDFLKKHGADNDEKLAAINELPLLFGGEEVFPEAEKIAFNDGAKARINYLKDLYSKLSELGYAKKITLDLGLVQKIDYYSGLVFCGYIEGIGQTVLSGGRYDNLSARFGCDFSATGFAVNVDAVAKLKMSGVTEKENNDENKPIRIALTKGRLEKKTIELLEKTGINCDAIHNKGRKLVLYLPDINAEVVLAKAADVITYIERGACDIGVVGKDTIMEYGTSFYEVLDLLFGKCKFALANKKGTDFYAGHNVKVIASKYTNVARSFFEGKNMDVELIHIDGSVELAPILGMADAIVDIVETGTTLKENGLEVIEDVADVSARLIVNTVSMKMKKDRIMQIIERLKSGMEA